MTRLLAHFLVACAVVVAPAARVLCNTSCAPDTGAVVEQAAAPECHESHEAGPVSPGSHPTPLEDDCTHGGESSSSSLFASVKAAKGDGVSVPVVSEGSVPYFAAVSSEVGRDLPAHPRTGQGIGLLLPPLRL